MERKRNKLHSTTLQLFPGLHLAALQGGDPTDATATVEATMAAGEESSETQYENSKRMAANFHSTTLLTFTQPRCRRAGTPVLARRCGFDGGNRCVHDAGGGNRVAGKRIRQRRWHPGDEESEIQYETIVVKMDIDFAQLPLVNADGIAHPGAGQGAREEIFDSP